MIHIVWNETDGETVWSQGRDDYRPYLFETLTYLGFAWRAWTVGEWSRELPRGVTVLLSRGETADWESLCGDYCRAGNALLMLGTAAGLPNLLGVRDAGRLAEGWISWGEDCPIADGLSSSFHCFDAALFTVADSADSSEKTEAWGQWTARNGTERKNPAFVHRRVGAGAAAVLAFDILKTLCLIQQGVPVLRDGSPAPDGSAPIDEGFLKTDDGTVLDWGRDRNPVTSGAVPFYLHPVADEIRSLLVKTLVLLHGKIGSPLVQTWFWPEGVTALGHISHDTDGNRPELAEIMLDRLAEAGVRSTWCTIMPGYPPAVYDRILGEGHELAFHYNALGTEIPESSWSETDFLFQLGMLREQVPAEPITTNKNHYLRWEGGVEFNHWCLRAGIRVEQSRGGTKQGNKGFVFGTCHPLRVVGSAAERNRPLEILSLPTLAWDPPMPARCTLDEAKALLRRSEEVYGVAHFLFHPGTVEQSAEGLTAGEAMVTLCRYGQERGMAWRTSREIEQWVSLRRGCRIESAQAEDGTLMITVSSAKGVEGLTLFFFQEEGAPWVSGDNRIRALSPKERFGRRGFEVILDVSAGTVSLTLRPAA